MRDETFDTAVTVVAVVISLNILLHRVVNVNCDSEFRQSLTFFGSTLFSIFNWAFTSLVVAQVHAFKKLFLKLSLRYAYKIGLMAEFMYPKQPTKRKMVTSSFELHIEPFEVIKDT